MNSKYSHLLWRGLFLLVGIVLIVVLVFARNNYLGSLYFVKATRGVHTEEVFEENLKKSIAFDHAHGYSNVVLARLLLGRNDLQGAEEMQKDGMKSFTSVRTFAQMGLIRELQGDANDAKKWYEKSMTMNPKNTDCLERLGVIALEQGDSSKVKEYAARIHDLDMNHVNASYLLAKDCENKNDFDAALRHYINISTVMSRVKVLGCKPLFEDDEIGNSISRLIKASKK